MASLLYPPHQASASSHYEPNHNPTTLHSKTALEVETINPNQRNRGGGGAAQSTMPEVSGVFLTWEDLWVTVSNGKRGSRSILHGLTGYASAGELLAIMGPSGCGKSTLLDALAGRLGSNTRQKGEILINGHKQALVFGTSAYVTQDDTLMTTFLTVKEAVYYSAQLQLPDSMSKSQKKDRADMTIREMGLQDAMNTRIGGWGSKGISGGQKRRVSICIEILTRPKLLSLDEPTGGLDSAASYYVMSRIARLDQTDGVGRTIIASVHQPSSEVFLLFHNLCLLSSGRTVYFGLASAANEFFTSNGFPCPTLQNPSDHFLKTINKDFEKDLEQGLCGGISTEEAINTLVRSYKSSDNYQQVQRQVAEKCKQDCGALETRRSHAGFLTQCFVLTRRSFLNMYRDLGYYWLRLAIYVALSLGIATVFYHLGSTYGSIQSLMMIVASFVPNFLMGIITGAGIQGLMILGGGFFRLPEDLPYPFWKYPLYYVAFHKYAYQGMFKNEFEGQTFPNNDQAGGPPTISGEDILRDIVDLAILLGMVVLYRLLFLGVIKITEKIKPIVTAFKSMSPKQTTQVMVNPSTTPIHGESL